MMRTCSSTCTGHAWQGERLGLRPAADPPRHAPGRSHEMRRGAGAVERGGLENRCAFTGTEGSNPSLSAIRRCRRSAAATNGLAGGAEEPSGSEAGAAQGAAETGERSEPNPPRPSRFQENRPSLRRRNDFSGGFTIPLTISRPPRAGHDKWLGGIRMGSVGGCSPGGASL